MDRLQEMKKYGLLLKKLVGNDLKSRYSGSVFGIVWAFIQPLVTILVFWYVFQIGFRNPPVDNIEFILRNILVLLKMDYLRFIFVWHIIIVRC